MRLKGFVFFHIWRLLTFAFIGQEPFNTSAVQIPAAVLLPSKMLYPITSSLAEYTRPREHTGESATVTATQL